MNWVVETLDAAVDAELDALPADMRARFVRIARLIQSQGLPNVGMPHLRPLESGLWEMRMTGRDGIARAIYVAAKQRHVIVVRAFVKKTQKTPRREIEIALERAKRIGR
jgi:phage-related protein